MSNCLRESKLQHAREKLGRLVSGNDYNHLFAPLRLIECQDDGSAKFQWTLEKWQMNGIGILHGGYITSVVGFVTSTGLYLADCEDYAGAEINVSFLRPAKEGDIVTIETCVVSRGSNIAFTRATLMHNSGEIIATATNMLTKVDSYSTQSTFHNLFKQDTFIKNMLPLDYAQNRFTECVPKWGFSTFLLSGRHLQWCTSDGNLEMKWTVDGTQLDQFKHLDIGYIAAIFDFATGMGPYIVTDNSPGYASVDLSLSYYRPCFEGEVITVETKVLKRGQTLVFVEASFVNADGKLIAMGKQTMLKVNVTKFAKPKSMLSSKM